MARSLLLASFQFLLEHQIPTTSLASSITRIPGLGLYHGFLCMSFDWQTPPFLGPQHPHQYGERRLSVSDRCVLYKREIELQAGELRRAMLNLATRWQNNCSEEPWMG